MEASHVSRSQEIHTYLQVYTSMQYKHHCSAVQGGTEKHCSYKWPRFDPALFANNQSLKAGLDMTLRVVSIKSCCLLFKFYGARQRCANVRITSITVCTLTVHAEGKKWRCACAVLCMPYQGQGRAFAEVGRPHSGKLVRQNLNKNISTSQVY